MSKTCPTCGTSLSQLQFQAVLLDTCNTCGGIWFDEGELKALQSMAGETLQSLEDRVQPDDAVAVESAEGKNCPVCSTRMRTYKYQYSSGIQLEECEKCGGIWVDNGELQRMEEFAAKAEQEELSPQAVAAMAQIELDGAIQRKRNIARLLNELSIHRSPVHLAPIVYPRD